MENKMQPASARPLENRGTSNSLLVSLESDCMNSNKNLFQRIIFVLAALIGGSALVPCLSAQEATGAKVKLFDGETMHGWHVSKCEAEVLDGAILLKSGNGFVRTDAQYRNFILELEWKPLQEVKFDSGIYIRAKLPTEEQMWPQKYQVNLLEGNAGNLIGFPQAVSKGLTKKNDWNQMRLKVAGSVAEMEINGQAAWKVDNVPDELGYIGFQAEVPNGGQFLFRNIAITELDHEALFNGHDLTNWEGGNGDAGECWEVKDGLLICTGNKGPWLRSKEEFADFNLRLQYRVSAGGNSGVYIRVPQDGNHHGKGAGIEIQILDDPAEQYKDLKAYQYSGSLYAIAPAAPRVGRTAGQWNNLEIDCSAHRYLVIHNGVIVINANAEQHPELTERNLSGFLGLQNHSTEVAFRNLRLGPSMQTESVQANRESK